MTAMVDGAGVVVAGSTAVVGLAEIGEPGGSVVVDPADDDSVGDRSVGACCARARACGLFSDWRTVA